MLLRIKIKNKRANYIFNQKSHMQNIHYTNTERRISFIYLNLFNSHVEKVTGVQNQIRMYKCMLLHYMQVYTT